MAKAEKIIERLRTVPLDFTWAETVKVLEMFGHSEQKTGKTGGSRRKFIDKKNNTFSLHKPHPEKILKRYAVENLLAYLIEKGHIKDE